MNIQTKTVKETIIFITNEEREALRTVYNILERIYDEASNNGDCEDYDTVSNELRRIFSDVAGRGYINDTCLDVLNMDSFPCMVNTIGTLAISADVQKK